ncbi:MAG: hypothetical protein HXX10_19355 [Rhodoplanes sp.]|uniref:YciI family protein n=1 Tax=Rhodoplanes sp. TaxID=1968906 RepID=UPI0017C08BF7|nr:YciI family protein [Rhodoplanes sp.]NVO16196.1 hypothetical protein [Rhodoplanes sp.]
MQFFVYGRDRDGAGPTRRALLKDHWAFMTPYIDAMIARGPTMSADGKAVTGSLHIVDLADAEAARVFAEDDPLAKGGVFAEVMVRRFDNLSGRTMWQFAGDPKNPRFLFVGEARPDAARAAGKARAAQRAWLLDPAQARAVIVAGPLLGADGESSAGETWAGTAMLLEASDTAAAEALLRDDPAADLYETAVLRPWRFGGAENLQDLIAGR